MPRVARLCFLVTCFIVICSSALLAENVEQTLIRMFSYDPHPGSAVFADKAPFNGKMHDFEIVFVESWQAKDETGTLKQIGFKIQAKMGEQIVASSDITPVVAGKISKDQQMGNVKIGDVSFSASVTDIAKNKSGITDLTVSFKLSYDNAGIDSLQSQPDSNAAPGGLNFARKLADRAAAMADDKPAARISMYNRALMAAPAADTSPEAAAFHKEINGVIASLQGSAPSFEPFRHTLPGIEKPAVADAPVATETASAVNGADNPADMPVATSVADRQTETPVPASNIAVPEQAVANYKEARTFFAQNKGPEGREALRKALEIAPAYHDALLLLGDNATENRRWARAKDAFKQALDVRERDADTLLKYFKACYYIGEGADAILYLEQVRNKYPTERRIQLTVAEANFQLGDLPAAKALCDEMLNKDPGDTRARDLLQRVNRLHK
ncbi:MAG: hypothetical protein CVV41_21050 [Candidatus Riflebacteria bacterium HGW-Riflebacteria-1]|jgi:tetratricopeptide (TPR) repeat protein|nr:MAG: hypothetical protein CVV41_21050 [Candidatus Riflebacteria bacterium HGW-Riflebacteria-1]